MGRQPRSAYSTGLLLALACYGMWGVFPIYFELLLPAGPLEVLGNRIVWTLVFLAVVVTVRKLWPSVRQQLARPKVKWLLALAAIAVSVNWGVYIWAVQNNHVVEASLGYFINPLVSVLFGVVLLGERLRRLQWWAVALAALAVAELTVAYGRPPWIGIILAMSFAIYSLIRKKAAVPPVEALTIETSYLFPFALAVLIWLQMIGHAVMFHDSVGNTVLLMLAGVVTAVPLLAFGGAINRLPLSTIGLMQYITPVIQFVLGVTLFHEEMSTGRWIGFAIVWAALVLMSIDAIRTARDPNWVGGQQVSLQAEEEAGL
jgi:chloramphenicol-sensitive protein RarD